MMRTTYMLSFMPSAFGGKKSVCKRDSSLGEKGTETERERVACHCHATLSGRLADLGTIWDNYERLRGELRKKVIAYVKRLEAAERKRAHMRARSILKTLKKKKVEGPEIE
jgi:hypothetical protein